MDNNPFYSAAEVFSIPTVTWILSGSKPLLNEVENL